MHKPTENINTKMELEILAKIGIGSKHSKDGQVLIWLFLPKYLVTFI